MNIVIGEEYEVKPIRYTSCGVIVEMSDNSTQLIHISNISDNFIKDIKNVIHIGHTYRCKAIKGKARPVELSLKKSDFNNTTNHTDNIEKKLLDRKQSSKSLDDMIEKMNRDYEDKVRSLKLTKSVRRRSFKSTKSQP